ncbi:MAG: alpha/beta hydrolase family protein [Planctomycetota bacterium]|jgi:dienelactone hydrolase
MHGYQAPQVPIEGARRSWLRSGLLRAAAVLASSALLTAAVAVAQEEEDTGPSRDELIEIIGKLRKQYLEKLDAGREDRGLRDLIRELNAARNKGDWDRVAELLTEHGLLGAKVEDEKGSGGNADDLWPIRTGEDDGKADASFTIEKAEYTTPEGLKAGALVYRPKEALKKMPIIVLGHGGFRGIPVAYRNLAEELANVGYLVYVPELRGRGKSGGKPEYARGEVLDLLAGLEEAKQLENVDPNRVGLVGGGHGGAVVLIALARAEGVVCASVISAPTNLPRLVREVPVFARELRLLKTTIDFSDTDDLRRRSPLYYVGGLQVPVQVLHGSRDTMVPYSHARGYASVLENRGKEVEFLKYGLSGNNLVSKISTYRVDLHNFLAQRLRPPGWKIQKKAGKGKADDKATGKGKGKKGAEDAPRRERRRH